MRRFRGKITYRPDSRAEAVTSRPFRYTTKHTGVLLNFIASPERKFFKCLFKKGYDLTKYLSAFIFLRLDLFSL
jgi:hypothetical protein